MTFAFRGCGGRSRKFGGGSRLTELECGGLLSLFLLFLVFHVLVFLALMGALEDVRNASVLIRLIRVRDKWNRGGRGIVGLGGRSFNGLGHWRRRNRWNRCKCNARRF